MRAEKFRGRSGYATVEEAATAGIPARYVRILAVRVVADHAAVLAQENEPPVVIETLSVLERSVDRWYSITEGSVGGSGSTTWTSTDDGDDEDPTHEDLGVGCAVYQLPAGIASAVVGNAEWTDRLEASPSGWVIALHWPVTCADWQPGLVPAE